MEAEVQALATSLARSVDLKLKTYHAALETIAQSYSLAEEFNLERIEWEARHVGALFGGWFVITTTDEQIHQLMNTRTPEGVLPEPYARTSYPELTRAEEESLRLGRSVTSDAFIGRVTDELIVSTVTGITIPDASGSILGFAVTLNDITAWLRETNLEAGDFAAIADGSRRIIARSHDNEDFILAGLPDWYVVFSEGRNSGVAVVPPVQGGAPRLFAMQRLDVAPGWTLAVSRPLPSPLTVLYRSAWPALAGLFAFLLSGSVGALFLDRSRARSEAGRATAEVTERERLLAEVRNADAHKARLMAVLAHDMRTPLVAVLDVVDRLHREQDETARHRMLRRIREDGKDMLQLADDVLELARLGSGEARLRPEPFEITDILNQVADTVRPQAERNGTVVDVQADAIPALEGDVMGLRRVLLNFATNAVKATQGGSILLSATHDASDADGHTITCAVTDTGCGIAEGDIPRLFRDFGMLERDGLKADGTGLGLAICRRLAAAMGGEVGVESTLGEGSRFWMTLKLPGAATTAPAGEDTLTRLTSQLVGIKVLVAEDHPIIREMTCDRLARAGMIPAAAENGQIAVELAEAGAFDLILMDLQMPHLDGDAAAERIRRGSGPSAKARIVGITAYPSPDTALKLTAYGFDAFLKKPLDIQSLADLLQGTPLALPASAAPSEFDIESLSQLRDIDGGAILLRTLNAFSSDIETARIELPTLIAKPDLAAAGRGVHKLLGLSDTLGARALSAELRKLESLIQAGHIETLRAAFKSADEAMSRARILTDRLVYEETNQSRNH